MKLPRTALVVIIMAVITLVGCSSPTSTGGNPSAQTSGDASTPTVTTVVHDANAAACASANLKFGDTCEDQSQIQYMIDQPVEFTPPSDVSDPAGDGHAVKMTMTVFNGSSNVWDPGMLVLSCTPGGGLALVDPSSGVGWPDVSSEQDQVAPGQGATATVGCWTTDPASVQVQVGNGNNAGHWSD